MKFLGRSIKIKMESDTSPPSRLLKPTRVTRLINYVSKVEIVSNKSMSDQ